MKLLTFDIFGTVVDWRTGLLRDAPSVRDFDAVIDRQGELEREDPARRYSSIVAQSLEERGVTRAREIGAGAGRWPVFSDSPEALRRLRALAPCVAMTNSDRAHGPQVQEQLGFRLSHWITAEESGVYKPSPEFWRFVSKRLGVPFGADWWHVSAYADYDLEVAKSLGLTTVFVDRPHSRPGPADRKVRDLLELALSLSRPSP